MGRVIFDGISVIYVSAVLFLLIIWAAIFTRRQIVRIRKNASRSPPKIALNSRVTRRKTLQLRTAQLDSVIRLRKENQARLTDCVTLAFHHHKAHLHRMIAFDEVTAEIDGQLQRIEGAVHRLPGESTYNYLCRIRQKVPEIPMSIIYRIAFIQESARFRPETFDESHVMELRTLLKLFMKILGEQYSTLELDETDNSPSSVMHSIYQKIMPTGQGSKRKRNKFGGSDGVRLMIRDRDEQLSLLSSPEHLPRHQQTASLGDGGKLPRRQSHSALIP